MCGNDHVFSNVYVVSDVNEIIDFRSPPDAGHIQGSAIKCSVRADFDVILDLQPTDLREFFVATVFGIPHVSETVASQHGTRVDDDSITEPGAGINGDVGIEPTVFSQDNAGAQHTTCADDGSLADLDVFANHGQFFDADVVGKFRVRMNDRRGVHNCREGLSGVQPCSRPGEREPRLGGNQKRL